MNLLHEEIDYLNPLLRLKTWTLNTSLRMMRQPTPEGAQPSKWQWHYHKEVEFLLVLEGQIETFVADKRWTLLPGDVIVFGSNEPHFTRPLCPELKQIVLQFDMQAYFDPTTMKHYRYLQEHLRPLSDLNYMFREHSEAKTRIASAIREICQEAQIRSNGYEIALSGLIRSIIFTLVRYDSRNVLGYGTDASLDLLEPVLTWVDRHYGEKITVKAASCMVNLSYRHFLRVFKQAMGMPFTEYVNQKRMKIAVQKLLTTQHSVQEIALQAGIPNIAHFYHLFHKYYGCSPKQYQRQAADRVSERM